MSAKIGFQRMKRRRNKMCEERPVLELVGQGGNAFNILGLARRAARNAGWSEEKIDAFLNEAMAGDYNHLLCVCMDYFEVV
jgi:hypothetical protein